MGAVGGLANEILAIAQVIIVSVIIGLGRFYGFTLMFPLFTWIDLQGLPRLALSLGFSLPSIIVLHALLRETGLPATNILLLLVAKEVALGAVFGMILGVPFWAIQGAADALDVYRGGSAANLMDPVNAQEMSVGGTLMGLLTMALFVTMDGIPQLVDILFRSQDVWPLMTLTPPFDIARLKGLLDVAAGGLVFAIVVIAPLFMSLFMIDVALTFAVRGAKSFQIYDLTQVLRGFVLLMILPIFVVLFADHLKGYSRTFLLAVRNGLNQLMG